MEATVKRRIRSGRQYDHLFPEPKWKDKTVRKGATLADTMLLLPKVIQETKSQTEKIAKRLKGKNNYETCRNIWRFVYEHIQYERDAHGTEQIRTPARTWAERKRGVDCDCYTVFISTILCNLGIAHRLRVTKNTENYFQHIYVVVPDKKHRQIIIDCVVDSFDHEAFYKEKMDHEMDLQYLSGLGNTTSYKEPSIDMEDLTGAYVDDIGFLKNFGKKIGKTLKKGLHAINRINPATVLLRNGLLAGMKLNMMKIAERMRYAYLTEAQARARSDINMNNFPKLLQTRQKLEKIFFGAGGKPENLRKAILTGKGNRDKDVPLSGLAGFLGDNLDFNENSALRKVLGEELYHDEITELEGLGQLGEPITTTAAITAASGALAAIALALKKVGEIKKEATDIFKGDQPKPSPKPRSRFNVPTRTVTLQPVTRQPQVSNGKPAQPTTTVKTNVTSSAPAPESRVQNQETPEQEPKEKGFFEKIGDWIKDNPGKTAAIGGGVVIGVPLTVWGIKKLTAPKPKPVAGLSGKGKSTKKKQKQSKKQKPKTIEISGTGTATKAAAQKESLSEMALD